MPRNDLQRYPQAPTRARAPNPIPKGVGRRRRRSPLSPSGGSLRRPRRDRPDTPVYRPRLATLPSDVYSSPPLCCCSSAPSAGRTASRLRQLVPTPVRKASTPDQGQHQRAGGEHHKLRLAQLRPAPAQRRPPSGRSAHRRAVPPLPVASTTVRAQPPADPHIPPRRDRDPSPVGSGTEGVPLARVSRSAVRRSGVLAADGEGSAELAAEAVRGRPWRRLTVAFPPR